MKVISDTTVLIALSCLGELDLLKRLWGKVLIPEMVYQEVLRGGTSSAGGREVKKAIDAGWVVVQKAKLQKEVAFLKGVLEPGEAEVLVLGNEVGGGLLLIDEKKARRIAFQSGFEVLGVLGILLLAVTKGIIDRNRVPGMLTTLQEKNFRLSDELIQKVLRTINIQ